MWDAKPLLFMDPWDFDDLSESIKADSLSTSRKLMKKIDDFLQSFHGSSNDPDSVFEIVTALSDLRAWDYMDLEDLTKSLDKANNKTRFYFLGALPIKLRKKINKLSVDNNKDIKIKDAISAGRTPSKRKITSLVLSAKSEFEDSTILGTVAERMSPSMPMVATALAFKNYSSGRTEAVDARRSSLSGKRRRS